MYIPKEIKEDPRWKALSPNTRTNAGKMLLPFRTGQLLQYSHTKHEGFLQGITFTFAHSTLYMEFHLLRVVKTMYYPTRRVPDLTLEMMPYSASLPFKKFQDPKSYQGFTILKEPE